MRSAAIVGGGCRMKELVRSIAQALVDRPDEVEVREIAGEKTTVLELKVADTDLGKIIGRQGRTARAMRTIVNAAATKLKKRAVLEILE
jgi:predicted RNA-binding protein YlqC (UPF0109 family)